MPLTHPDLVVLRRVAGDNQNWAGVEPSIFGTLFERILDPKKRAQIGAHYTSKGDILLVIEPVIMTPLRRRWQAVQEEIKAALDAHANEPNRKKRDVLSAPIRVAAENFRLYLGRQRVLDPACGSGNFLYVALQQLLDLEDEVVRFCARRDITLDPTPRVRPTQLHGIEINPYAAELAQVVIWIGYLQWLHVHGIEDAKRPILDALQTIENRDAILDLTDQKFPKVAAWPETDFIVGNPPFLGSKLFRSSGLENSYLDCLRVFDLPRTSDLCCYWFEIARLAVERKKSSRVGLLATQGIRGQDNREVLERIKNVGDIFLAWSDRKWILEGAAVHVSIIGFDDGSDDNRFLDGKAVATLNANLSSGTDLTTANRLDENTHVHWSIGTQKSGNFDIAWNQARELLATPGPGPLQPNSVLFPWLNGRDMTSRPRAFWVIYFDDDVTLQEAAQTGETLEFVRRNIKPSRDLAPHIENQKYWWIHERPRPGLLNKLSSIERFIATSRVAKHLLFSWFASPTVPDSAAFVFARSDDYFFGVLHSSLHAYWARRLGTQLREAESGSRYTPSTSFETFPLPWPPGKEDTKHPVYARIAAAAKTLDAQRERWLNPPEWVEPLAAKIDAADDFADVPADARPLVRRSAIMAAAAKDARLKKRTLTNLYNERPTWLKLAHETLDRAVLAAYATIDPQGGWDEDWAAVWVDTGAGQPLATDHPLHARRVEIDGRVLAALLRLNHERAGVTPAAGGPAAAVGHP